MTRAPHPQCGSAATTARLQRQLTRAQVDRELRAGRLVRVRRGVYVTATADPVCIAALSVRGVLSHLSAAQHLGLGVVPAPERIHVTVPRGRHTSAPDGVVLHRVALSASDQVGHCTSALRTALDCATALSFAEALAVADGALRAGLLDQRHLEAAAADTRGPGRARRLRVAAQASALAANPFESALRATILDAGLTRFTPQLRIPGTPFVVDLADSLARVALEADSFAHHGTREALREDCRRYDEITRLGWVVLRFAWEHVMFEPDWVASVVSDCVRRR